MTDKLKDAIKEVRMIAETCNDYQQWVLRLVADAAEHPKLTPEFIAAHLPDWAAGTCYDPNARKWCVMKRRPDRAGDAGWLSKDENPWEYLPLDLPAPDDWRESWTPKPEPKLRCPWPGCDGEMEVMETATGREWTLICTACETMGPRCATREMALKIARGCTQPGTVDRGSFAQYVEGG